MGLWNWFRSLWWPLRAFWRWLRDGRGFDVEELARRLAVPEKELHSLKPAYEERRVPKRSGGQRVLFIPSNDLKFMQRRLLRRLLRRLRCHPAAKGFQPGESIVTNALPHVGQAVVVRLDLHDFFPATTAHRVYRYFRRIGWNRPAARVLTRLVTHKRGLPQGAPTSPRLSNLVNYRLDRRIAAMADKLEARYTRYADDITLSFAQDERDQVRYLIRFVRRVVAQEGYRLHARKKLRILRRHQQQRVTGLVVNAGARLPRRLRRWLRAVEHHLAAGRPATLTPAQLAGWRAFRHMIAQQGGARKQSGAVAGPLEGAWVVISPTPEAPTVWVFGQEELLMVQGGREERASYKLDVSTEPASITITSTAGPEAGPPVEGTYARQADQLTLLLAEPGRGRPLALTAEPGTGHVLLQFRAAPGWPGALPPRG